MQTKYLHTLSNLTDTEFLLLLSLVNHVKLGQDSLMSEAAYSFLTEMSDESNAAYDRLCKYYNVDPTVSMSEDGDIIVSDN